MGWIARYMTAVILPWRFCCVIQVIITRFLFRSARCVPTKIKNKSAIGGDRHTYSPYVINDLCLLQIYDEKARAHSSADCIENHLVARSPVYRVDLPVYLG